MKTLGYTKVALLPLMILVITMGSSIASPTPTVVSPTSGGSTSYRSENLKEGREKLPQSQTGKDITEALTILNEILEKLEKTLSEEKSSHSTQLLEK